MTLLSLAVLLLTIVPTPSAALTDCLPQGTTRKTSAGECICKDIPIGFEYFGEKCNKRKIFDKNGQLKYLIIFDEMTWDKGKKLCEDLGMYMGTPMDQEENDAVMDHMKKDFDSPRNCWIGISNAANKMEWRYVGGKEKGLLLWEGKADGHERNGCYTNWFSNEPNDHGGIEDSGEMMGIHSGKWNDVRRDHLNWAVLCGLLPTNTTTLTRTISRSVSLTPPASESLLLTIVPTPSAAFTDCLPQGTTRKTSAGECICKDIPIGFEYFGEKCNKRKIFDKNGQLKYLIIFDEMTWDKGKKLCEDLGMYMGTPMDQEENDAVMDHMKKDFDSPRNCWIGISNAANKMEWRYVGGKEKGLLLWEGKADGHERNGCYTNWFSNEPNDHGGIEDSGEMMGIHSGKWNDVRRDHLNWAVLCGLLPTNTTTLTRTISRSVSLTPPASESLTHSITHSITELNTPSPTVPLTPSPTGSLTPSPTGSLTPSPTGPLTPSPTGSLTPSPTGSLTPSPTAPLTPSPTVPPIPGPTVPPIPNGHRQCFDGPLAIKPAMIRAPDLLVNGEFMFTIEWSPIPHAGKVLEPIVEGLLGMGTADTIHVAKCNMTASKGSTELSYRCRFRPPYASLPVNGSSIFLRYMPSPQSWCPLGSVGVVQPRDGVGSSQMFDVSFAPVCPVMTNGLTDGSVFLLVGTSPCATEESQQGGEVATHIIAPFSFLGHAATVFGNYLIGFVIFVVVLDVLCVGRCAGWPIFTEHPIMKYVFGFRATLLGLWFWIAELTYPGVVVGTFGLIRTGEYNGANLGALILGCVYLVVNPVMALVVTGPFRSGYVTYGRVNLRRLHINYGNSLFVPQGTWGGTGPALGPVTQPFAGIRKAAVCAPLSYIVMAVVGAVLHGMGPGTSCVARLATVAALLFVVSVAIAVTRPFRYHINSLLYNITFNLLAIYTALLAISASRHGVEHNSQEHRNNIAMGFAQLGIGMTICIVFLVRGAVFVGIMIREGRSYRVFNDNHIIGSRY